MALRQQLGVTPASE